MLLEATGDEIAELSDEALRTLIARLCEAEVRERGFLRAAVTAGGDQTAADGGLDVRVDLGSDASITGWIPRPHVGWRSKRSDMPKAAILRKMQPAGVLRGVIADLAAKGGAYIIVSAKGSVSDSALADRRSAMRGALRSRR